MMYSDTSSIGLGGAVKIQAEHLNRNAYIYVRQSSPKQVQHNRESQEIQYRLAQRAEALGWLPEQIRIIDADLGLSGESGRYRQGFQELVTALSLGQVGIVFGYEVSRLARNNSDWYQLLDLAAMFDTLIADYEGIYDPARYNDRLLLGLKGTMSEAELHLIRQRMDAGRMNQVMRGDYRQQLPVGLIRLPNGAVVKDPDDQVRHMIEMIFAKFDELGSCHKVLAYLQTENLLLPRRLWIVGTGQSEIVWRPASDSMVYAILSNPAYAGAFVYGRTQTEKQRRRLGQPGTGRANKPPEEWIHLQHDVYPAYISWERYSANQERMHQNIIQEFSPYYKGNRTQGAARKGAALLQGMVICGMCGCQMIVRYKSTPRYECRSSYTHRRMSVCQNLHAPSIEQVVVEAFFEALRPAQLNALEKVLTVQHVEYQRLAQQWRERIQRAQYDTQLAERQYNIVDPTNRLVSAELERRWEAKLRELQETQAGYERFQQRPLPPQIPVHLRIQFQHISETMPDLWPQLSSVQKKELLRSLIKNVILKRTTPDAVEVRIVWVSGHLTVLNVSPPIERQKDLANYEELVKRTEQLWRDGLSDEQIAQQLTQEGFRSARSENIAAHTVVHLRVKNNMIGTHYKCRGAGEFEGYLTVLGLAKILQLTTRTWVYRRIQDGTIGKSYLHYPTENGPTLIKNDPQLIQHLLQLRKRFT